MLAAAEFVADLRFTFGVVHHHELAFVHLHIVDDVFLQGRSVVTKSINKAGAYSSVLSVEEAGKWRKLAARFKRQEETAKKLKQLEKQLKATTEGSGSAE